MILPGLISAAVFLAMMHVLNKKNFNADGTRKHNWRELTPDLLGKQIEYHNNATYKAFEFYMKILLALMGGIAFLAIQKPDNIIILHLLLSTGGRLIYPLTIIFCVLIFVHQKSKIERWNKGFRWYYPLFWNECWFISTAVSIAFFMNGAIIPLLIENINN